MSAPIQQFFSSEAYAVIGASTDREKFGNKVLRCYLLNNKTVYPVNPRNGFIEGLTCIADIAALPDTVKSISIITPPIVTEIVVEQAIKKGIKNIWMQPGAESESAIRNCQNNRINVIANGPCILIELGFAEH
ncbi:acetyl coenzyme A synthetase (ADP forming), alpha domain [Legionella massiliensis]|uniref:Acetyl coenzyme A synthetase (ADP forming), alpha domain n=2 Tax=Legionella massiliensis TaxID=1034943 RepID=A0A078KX48_9GAMM|nr:acetyl coenzyme A synthetase (ADP forming), alpha domain [Legionella massiliensis]CEE13279.1 CoA binding domain protein [Legionella massiliensis]